LYYSLTAKPLEADNDEILCVDPEARVYDPGYVGEAIAIEAAEAYYSCNVFFIHPANCARAMHRLLTVDGRLPFVHRIFNTSIGRARNEIKPYFNIRRIHINISLKDYEAEQLWQPSAE
jgi:hypothetical protein